MKRSDFNQAVVDLACNGYFAEGSIGTIILRNAYSTMRMRILDDGIEWLFSTYRTKSNDIHNDWDLLASEFCGDFTLDLSNFFGVVRGFTILEDDVE